MGDYHKTISWKITIGIFIDELIDSCDTNNITILPIDYGTLKMLKALPFLHRDPFDRIIIATSIELGLDLISSDEIAKKYTTRIIW
ncbi:PIN domain nuclease of toxin-antitoxin system [Pedobacter sp. AK013]|uniref:PIN domain-containing protein n=1 Tax=Pedobacter sp. AK013 TaxID=2723071 RepID=UPI00161539ED|nr:PIN domain nuclease of toxin-antitoxin system [Pedobacter sp. AK013]